MAKSIGTIVEINRNYGTISTQSFKRGDELVPFEITKDMIVYKDGIEYFAYTKEVEFELKRDDNVRNRQVKEAYKIDFVGDNTLYKERKPVPSYIELVKQTFEDYCFEIPSFENDNQLYEYLKEIGFQPKMLEYLLSGGIFLKKSIYKLDMFNAHSIDVEDIDFDPRLIVFIDKIDSRFRSYCLNWIIGLENSYKGFISRVCSGQNGNSIAKDTISHWKTKNNKGERQIKLARSKRKYREYSNLFDYAENPDLVPIEDLMEQLDLSELGEFTKAFKGYANKHGFSSPWLNLICTSSKMIADLAVLRNAAAHGRPLVPGFSDPDYNANWDLEFDNADTRTNIRNWLLYEPIKQQWQTRMEDEYIDSIIVTIFCNPYRRGWVELNFLYESIVRFIDPEQFKQFRIEATAFLDYNPENPMEGLKTVNPLNLKLSDMGPTTIEQTTGIPAPYKEIANEATDIWAIFDNEKNLTDLYEPFCTSQRSDNE